MAANTNPPKRKKSDDPIFYVYEHWRPDKGECFYVGKGQGRRAYEMGRRNRHHQNIQNKLLRIGLSIEVRFVAMNLADAQALALEIERIAIWRADGADLANLTNGGEGMSGYRPPDDVIKARNEKLRGKKRSAETLEKQRLVQTGKKASAETRALLSEQRRGVLKSEEHKKNISLAHLCQKRSPEAREAMRIAQQRRRSTERAQKELGHLI